MTSPDAAIPSLKFSPDPTIQLAAELIRCPSVTPQDHGAQEIISRRLSQCGFQVEKVERMGVANLWAELGKVGPLFVFAGHTDVVPPGESVLWQSDPFTPVIRNNRLYGRGAADMKGGIAAFITAVEKFIRNHEKPKEFSLGILIAGDEEVETSHGTSDVLEMLSKRGKKIDYCIMAEPSSTRELCDCIRIGRRGSLTGTLKVFGIQGHSAYPERAKNPIHDVLPALLKLANEQWDQGDSHFPATTLQITNIHSGTGASNVIPAILEATFNTRFSPIWTIEKLQARCDRIMKECALDFELRWFEGARSFLTEAGFLRQLVLNTIEKELKLSPTLSTAGGTSDARFIAPTGAQVVEMGLLNETVHQANEWVSIADLTRLSEVFEALLVNFSQTLPAK